MNATANQDQALRGCQVRPAALVLLVQLLLPLVVTAAPLPVAVSPGSEEGVPTIATRCPTFSWGLEPDAPGSVLSIWSLDDDGVETAQGSGAHRRVEITGDARSWTPTGESCLEAGGTYAWRVETDLGSSEPRFFRIAGGEWLDEVLEEVVLELVERRRQAELGSVARTSPSPGSAGAPPLPAFFTLGEPTVELDDGDTYALWAEGDDKGIFATSNEPAGRAIFASSSGGNGSVASITGISDSSGGRGVYGVGETHGVRGIAEATNGIGVEGIQSGATSAGQGNGCGVRGTAFGATGFGVSGLANATSGTTYGVYGASSSASGFDFYAAGSLSTDYGPFTGAHEARLLVDLVPIEPGMVVSVTGRAETRRRESGTGLSSTVPTVELSDRPYDPRVFGVFVAEMELRADHWLEDKSGRFAIVNALGEGRVWVTDANGPVRLGDYLTTSSVPGYAQRQAEAVQRSYTLGKVTEEIDWESVPETVDHEGTSYRAALIAVVYTSG